MKNRLTNNIGLKLASVLLAIVLWLVVTSANNPVVTDYYYNVPVTLLNTDLITDSGRVYDVIEGSDLISRVTVRAPRSVQNELTAENIIATADVNELSSLDTISIKLATNISNSQINSIEGSIDTVKLKIENKRNKALSLKASISGEVESGFIPGDITTDQNLVRISGPQSVIDKVVRASVNVEVDGMSSDIVTNAEIKLYDSDDKLINIEENNITMNIKTVGVKISIWPTTTIPVNFGVTGEPASGFRYTGEIDGNGIAVKVAGKANAIRNISSIEVPEEILDITDMTESLVKEVDIRQYLPDGVFLADPSDAVRTVTVHIQGEASRRIEVREEKIGIINTPEGYNASFSGQNEKIYLNIVGLSEDLSAISPDDIAGTIDIENWMQQQGIEELESGLYTIEVNFILPEEVSQPNPVRATLEITKEGEE